MSLSRALWPFALAFGALAVAGCQRTANAPETQKQAERAGAGASGSAARAAPDKPAQQRGGRVLGHLKTRNRLVTIRAGKDGPLYTVKSRDGAALGVDLTSDGLSAKFPELTGIVERGLASGEAWAGR